jgi:hypothetical protein
VLGLQFWQLCCEFLAVKILKLLDSFISERSGKTEDCGFKLFYISPLGEPNLSISS